MIRFKCQGNASLRMNTSVDAIAQGIKVDTVLDRVKQLEEDHERLLREKEKLEEMIIRKDES